MSIKRFPSVLIADDDKEICKLVEVTIKPLSKAIKIANTGKKTLEWVETFEPDILILDLSFPDLEGFSICSWIRKNEIIAQPIIIVLTARNSDKDKITGFDIGADEYISKPFSVMFLSKRIQMLWEQKIGVTHNTQKNTITYNEIALNIAQKRAFIDTKETYLTFMEWHILLILMEHPGRVFSRSTLIEMIKGNHYLVYGRTIDVHLSSLRKKLGDYGAYIRTKRSMGYYLDNT